ncbi:hypothetical protein [Flavobacterium piscisymbiosum]|uniref:Uncharacterized protein n=1 Tax=Flavobacterium piscisymbiosum TaxID=2893753 RepID=A0ABS8MGR4_9FLAO|nr:hypothetical protein [Flavobacterium sp. F-30]MCC9064678.1 hypothetical protein [Flavobacterium sp. F-30]
MTLKKTKVLVRDPRGLFNKIFKKDLTHEFELTDNSFLTENKNINDFDRFIFVIYNKLELSDFLKLEKKDPIFWYVSSVNVCAETYLLWKKLMILLFWIVIKHEKQLLKT